VRRRRSWCGRAAVTADVAVNGRVEGRSAETAEELVRASCSRLRLGRVEDGLASQLRSLFGRAAVCAGLAESRVSRMNRQRRWCV
jgi:hypothetical protein